MSTLLVAFALLDAILLVGVLLIRPTGLLGKEA